MRNRIVSIFMFAVIVLLLSGPLCGAAEKGAAVGRAMPDFTLHALDGQPVLVAPSGKVMILNFWAIRCEPCRDEMPDLNRFFQKYGEQVVFYAVNLQEPAEVVNNFMYRNGYSIPTLLDSTGEIGDLFAVRFIPTTVVVDRNGVIQVHRVGGLTMEELESIVNNL